MTRSALIPKPKSNQIYEYTPQARALLNSRPSRFSNSTIAASVAPQGIRHFPSAPKKILYPFHNSLGSKRCLFSAAFPWAQRMNLPLNQILCLLLIASLTANAGAEALFGRAPPSSQSWRGPSRDLGRRCSLRAVLFPFDKHLGSKPGTGPFPNAVVPFENHCRFLLILTATTVLSSG